MDTLLNIDEAVQGEAWKHFFLNVEQAVAFLRVASSEGVKLVVVAGACWSGTGWDTTKCEKAIRSLTGVALVTTKLKDYLYAFLYSLVLASGLDVAVLELTEGPAEVAFRLQDLNLKELTSASPPPKTSAKTALPSHEPAQEEDGEVGTPVFAWETPTLPLSDDLQLLVQKAAGGEKLDLKAFLENLPLWK